MWQIEKAGLKEFLDLLELQFSTTRSLLFLHNFKIPTWITCSRVEQLSASLY